MITKIHMVKEGMDLVARRINSMITQQGQSTRDQMQQDRNIPDPMKRIVAGKDQVGIKVILIIEVLEVVRL